MTTHTDGLFVKEGAKAVLIAPLVKEPQPVLLEPVRELAQDVDGWGDSSLGLPETPAKPQDASVADLVQGWDGDPFGGASTDGGQDASAPPLAKDTALVNDSAASLVQGWDGDPFGGASTDVVPAQTPEAALGSNTHDSNVLDRNGGGPAGSSPVLQGWDGDPFAGADVVALPQEGAPVVPPQDSLGYMADGWGTADSFDVSTLAGAAGNWGSPIRPGHDTTREIDQWDVEGPGNTPINKGLAPSADSFAPVALLDEVDSVAAKNFIESSVADSSESHKFLTSSDSSTSGGNTAPPRLSIPSSLMPPSIPRLAGIRLLLATLRTPHPCLSIKTTIAAVDTRTHPTRAHTTTTRMLMMTRRCSARLVAARVLFVLITPAAPQRCLYLPSVCRLPLHGW
jgi:hypothetical protein